MLRLRDFFLMFFFVSMASLFSIFMGSHLDCWLAFLFLFLLWVSIVLAMRNLSNKGSWDTRDSWYDEFSQGKGVV